MNTNITSVDADWPVKRLAEYLLKKEISGAPVVDNGELVGVVSLSDIAWFETIQDKDPEQTPFEPYWYYRRSMGIPLSDDTEPLELRGEYFEKAGTVREIMNPIIHEVEEDALIKEVAALMTTHHFHRVFVTRDSELLGIITSLDLVKLLAEEEE